MLTKYFQSQKIPLITKKRTREKGLAIIDSITMRINTVFEVENVQTKDGTYPGNIRKQNQTVGKPKSIEIQMKPTRDGNKTWHARR